MKLICWIFGHKWKIRNVILDGFKAEVETKLCKRCTAYNTKVLNPEVFNL